MTTAGVEPHLDLVGQRLDRLGGRPLGIVLSHRLAEGDRFRELGGVRDARGEDVVPVLRAKRLLVHLVNRLAGVEHRDQVAQERQAGVGQLGDQRHRFLDVDDPLRP